MTTKRNRQLVIVAPLALAALFTIAIASADDQPIATSTASTLQPGQMPPSANDSIFSIINADFEAIKPAFVRSCYDCHSDQTRFPWYAKLPIVKGLIESDIRAGRHHVDFSKGFPFSGTGSQAEMLTNIKSEIAEGAMPIRLYRIMHWGRLIEPPLQDTVFAWIDSSLARLATVGIVAPKREADSESEGSDEN